MEMDIQGYHRKLDLWVSSIEESEGKMEGKISVLIDVQIFFRIDIY